MKKLLLLVPLSAFFLLSFAQSQEKKTYYDQKVIANFRIIPSVFYDLSASEKLNVTSISKPMPKLLLPGLHLEIGPAINKRFFVNMAIGLDGNKNNTLLTIYPDIHINLMKGKYAPVLNFGGGYAYNNTPAQGFFGNGVYNGATALGGLGFNANVLKHLSISISLDYRFIYEVEATANPLFTDQFYGFNETNGAVGSIPKLNYFRNQLGMRLSFTIF